MALLPTRMVLTTRPVRRRVDEAAVAGRAVAIRAALGLEKAATDALEGSEAERVIDRSFQGPLPETFARALVRNRVPARMLREALELQGEQPLDGKFDEDVGRLLASPVVRSALVEARSTATGEVLGTVGSRAEALDAALEAHVRRWFGRAPRPASLPGMAYPAGLVTRATAFAVDACVVTVIFTAGAAIVGAAAELAGVLRPAWLVALVSGLALTAVQVGYFAGSWTLAGQTPGMRLLKLRVTDAAGAPPGVLRSLVRWVGLTLSIVPCFAGFLPVLFDDRRRSFADFLAGTTVKSDGF
jgi:uncharacterized RDD family membrane protein YckC